MDCWYGLWLRISNIKYGHNLSALGNLVYILIMSELSSIKLKGVGGSHRFFSTDCMTQYLQELSFFQLLVLLGKMIVSVQ